MVSVVATSDCADIAIVAAVVESAFALVAVPVPVVTVGATIYVALAGIELSSPIPSEATVASAMRLNVVFVDIYFLSIVVIETFPMAALR